VLGISAGEFGCFLLFWSVNLYFIVRGMDSIKRLEALSAPFLLLIGLALVVWAWRAADGFGPSLRSRRASPAPRNSGRCSAPVSPAMVGFWATLSLNIPDFSRFARTQRDQIVGQAMGCRPR
jgi:NCS1 family nucleobase:cation symporter-1